MRYGRLRASPMTLLPPGVVRDSLRGLLVPSAGRPRGLPPADRGALIGAVLLPSVAAGTDPSQQPAVRTEEDPVTLGQTRRLASTEGLPEAPKESYSARGDSLRERLAETQLVLNVFWDSAS